MIIIPAIDLLEGKVVRLFKGDMDKITVYADNPCDMAKRFSDMGVSRLHIVDLDGARSGTAVNFKSIEAMASIGTMEIEVGGGIRSVDRITSYFNAGVTYAILGTVIVKDPETTSEALKKYPERIILGVDARNGIAATEGWYESSGVKASDIINSFAEYKAESVIYTDIDKDGTLEGLNLEELVNIAEGSPFPIIASGGVSSSKDLDNLYELNNKNIKGCIVGKAYYEGKIDIEAEIRRAASFK